MIRAYYQLEVDIMKIDKEALYLLAVAALEGAKKQYETPNKPKEEKKNLPKDKN